MARYVSSADLFDHLTALHAANDVDSVSTAILRAVGTLSDSPRVLLLLPGESHNRLVARARYYENAIVVSATQGRPLDRKLSRLLASRRVQVVTSESPAFRNLLAILEGETDLECPVVVLPLRSKGMLRAVIVLRARQPVATEAFFSAFLHEAATALSRVTDVDYLCKRLDELSTVVALDEAALSASSLAEASKRIVDYLKRLFGCEAARLMIFDRETKTLLTPHPVYNQRGELVGEFRMSLEPKTVSVRTFEGDITYQVPVSRGTRTIEVFETGKPYLTNDLVHDPLQVPSNLELLGTRSLLSVPLEVDGERIGVVSLANKAGEGFSERDVQNVCLLAPRLALLVRSARINAEGRQTVARLNDLAEVVTSQRESLLRTITAHDELTRAMLGGGGPQAVIACMVQLLGNPVIVEDHSGRPLGRERDIGDATSHELTGDAVAADINFGVPAGLQAALSDGHPARLAGAATVGSGQDRVLAAIVSGDQRLGTVIVLERNRRLDEIDFLTVEHAAAVLALMMTRVLAGAESHQQQCSAFVAQLLTGNYDSEVTMLCRAAGLAIDLQVSRVVLVARAAEDTARQARAVPNRDADDLLLATVAVLRHLASDATAALIGDEIVVLARAEAGGNFRVGLLRLADAMRDEYIRHHPLRTLLVGIGSHCYGPLDYPEAYAQARRAIDAILASGDLNRTLFFDQSGAYEILSDRRNRSKLASLVDRSIGGIMEYDRQHAAQLVQTLDTYLSRGCHFEDTAAVLHIHPNTLRYRLQRIEQITEVDLRNNEVRFDLQLAFRAKRALRV